MVSKRFNSSLKKLPFTDFSVEFEQYQKNLLRQIITWINRLIFFGIIRAFTISAILSKGIYNSMCNRK